MAVIDERAERQAVGQRMDDLARLEPLGQRPVDLQRQARIAGIAPIDVPVLLKLLAQRDPNGFSGHRALPLGDQPRGGMVRLHRGTGLRGGRGEEREKRGEGSEQADHGASDIRLARDGGEPPPHCLAATLRAGSAPPSLLKECPMDRPVPLIPLRTERLDLAEPCEADVPRMIELANDAEVARMLANLPHPYGEADARFFLGTLLPARSTWAMRLRGEGFIGMIGLHEEEPGAVNLGYWLGRPYWRRGYMREAAAAVVAHVRRSGLGRLSAGYWKDNAASARILARLSFEKTGERRLDHPLRGRAIPHVDVALRLDASG